MFDEAIKKLKFKIEVSNTQLDKLFVASTLLISCVDFRLRNETTELMTNHLMLLDDYDEISMPGGALALVEQKFPHWGETILDILSILEKMHHIKRVVLLDHRDCGAYHLIQGREHAKTRESETEAHKQVFSKAREVIKGRSPQLKIYTLLLGLDGVVENFSE